MPRKSSFRIPMASLSKDGSAWALAQCGLRVPGWEWSGWLFLLDWDWGHWYAPASSPWGRTGLGLGAWVGLPHPPLLSHVSWASPILSGPSWVSWPDEWPCWGRSRDGAECTAPLPALYLLYVLRTSADVLLPRTSPTRKGVHEVSDF